MNFTKSKKEFDNKGYLVISNFLNNDLSRKLKKKIIDSEKNNNNDIYRYYSRSIKNRKLILNRIENLYLNDRDVRKILSKKVSKLFKKLFKGNFHIFKDKVNFKNPGAKGFAPHQDSTIWNGMYGIKEYITLAISLDKSDQSNGCFQVSPKSHLMGDLAKHEKPISKKIEKKLSWKKIISRPGDLILFGDKLAHKSDDNTSGKTRIIYFLTYNPKKYGSKIKIYFKDKIKNYPPNNLRKKKQKYVYKV